VAQGGPHGEESRIDLVRVQVDPHAGNSSRETSGVVRAMAALQIFRQ
jgi:hypothetical protein